MYKLIIFDIDGTLVETKSGDTFRQKAEDWRLLPGRKEKFLELRDQNVRLALATNQPGVAFGYMEEADILRELRIMAKELRVPLVALYICYNHPHAIFDQYRMADMRRKPNPGMLLEAMQDFEASPEETLFVGDRAEDQQAAANAGVHFQDAEEFFEKNRLKTLEEVLQALLEGGINRGRKHLEEFLLDAILILATKKATATLADEDIEEAEMATKIVRCYEHILKEEEKKKKQ